MILSSRHKYRCEAKANLQSGASARRREGMYNIIILFFVIIVVFFKNNCDRISIGAVVHESVGICVCEREREKEMDRREEYLCVSSSVYLNQSHSLSLSLSLSLCFSPKGSCKRRGELFCPSERSIHCDRLSCPFGHKK